MILESSMVHFCDRFANEYSLTPVLKVFFTEVSGKAYPV